MQPATREASPPLREATQVETWSLFGLDKHSMTLRAFATSGEFWSKHAAASTASQARCQVLLFGAKARCDAFASLLNIRACIEAASNQAALAFSCEVPEH
jgi:hypothetical protein